MAVQAANRSLRTIETLDQGGLIGPGAGERRPAESLRRPRAFAAHTIGRPVRSRTEPLQSFERIFGILWHVSGARVLMRHPGIHFGPRCRGPWHDNRTSAANLDRIKASFTYEYGAWR
jgi:hypothetical protein